MKRILSMILLLVMLFSLSSVAAFAQAEEPAADETSTEGSGEMAEKQQVEESAEIEPVTDGNTEEPADELDSAPVTDGASTSGACGDNLTWSLDTETGELTVTGTGSMTAYSDDSYAPW